MPDYKRFPIILSSHSVAVIHIFERMDYLEDMWMSDSGEYHATEYGKFKDGAKQLVDQMEEHWCVAFLQALMIESGKRIIEQDNLCQTSHFDMILSEIKKLKSGHE